MWFFHFGIQPLFQDILQWPGLQIWLLHRYHFPESNYFLPQFAKEICLDLPSSLEISTHKIEDLALVSDTLKKSTIVSEVVFQKDVVATLTSWTSALRKIGIAVVIILSMVSIFIMVTIIGIKISQKREDIETMRLIGAGGWYVERWHSRKN